MSTSASLEAILERRLAALREHVPAAIQGEVVGVHQARVASRRLRELLPLLAVVDARGHVPRALRAIRRVTRVLGPVREADVALGHLEVHLQAHPHEAGDVARVRTWLTDMRAGRRDALLAEFDESGVARLWRRVEALPELAVLGAGAVPEWRRVLAGRIQERGAALAAEIEAAGVLYAADALHCVRIATKKLRYALELAGELRLAAVAASLKRLKAQQDLLGTIHDLEVLVGFADRAATTIAVRAGVARLVGEWHRECRELHSRYVRARPAMLRVTARASGDVTEKVAGPRIVSGRAKRAKSP